MPPLLQISRISKSFANGTVALADFNLELGEGEFLSLLGPSGCGKSTALRLIAGLAAPTSGSLRWYDAARHAQAYANDIGFVFQEPTLMPWSSVFDNVFLPLRLRGETRKGAQQRVDDALRQVGLEEFAHAFPRELSGGMKMRVSLARALVTRPRLLLLDEPFAALDEITRFRLNDDLLRLTHAHGITVIFVTHSVYESAFLSNRILVMAPRPGRVFAEIVVDGPQERDAGFRADPAFTRTCLAASDALTRAMGAEIDPARRAAR